MLEPGSIVLALAKGTPTNALALAALCLAVGISACTTDMVGAVDDAGRGPSVGQVADDAGVDDHGGPGTPEAGSTTARDAHDEDVGPPPLLLPCGVETALADACLS